MPTPESNTSATEPVSSTTSDTLLSNAATTTFATTANDVQSSPSSTSTLIIAVASVGGLLLLIAIVVVVVVLLRKKRQASSGDAPVASAAADAAQEEFDTSRTLSSRSTSKDYVTLSSVAPSSQGDNYKVLPSSPMREMDTLSNSSHYKDLAPIRAQYDIVTPVKPTYNLDEFA